eukprot:145098-Prymnesium_polylepis.1
MGWVAELAAAEAALGGRVDAIDFGQGEAAAGGAGGVGGAGVAAGGAHERGARESGGSDGRGEEGDGAEGDGESGEIATLLRFLHSEGGFVYAPAAL